jgi:HNH endonuclease
MAKKLLTDEARFLRAVEQMPNGCWQWKLGRDHDGYGCFRVGSHKDGSRKRMGAHRWSYQHFVGTIAVGLTIDHLCRNRACVNPAHLEPVAAIVNTNRGARATATHCQFGHPFSAQNLIISSVRKRRCRTCSQRVIRKWAKDNPEAMRAAQKRYRDKIRGERNRLRG